MDHVFIQEGNILKPITNRIPNSRHPTAPIQPSYPRASPNLPRNAPRRHLRPRRKLRTTLDQLRRARHDPAREPACCSGGPDMVQRHVDGVRGVGDGGGEGG